MTQLIAQRIVRLRHRIEGVGSRAASPGGRCSVRRRRPRSSPPCGFGSRRRSRAMPGKYIPTAARRRTARRSPGWRRNAWMSASRRRWCPRRPIFEAHQHDVDAVAIGGQRAGGVQQKLEHLVVGGDLDAVIEAQLAHPEGEGRFDSVRGEGGADDDGRAGHRIHHHYRGRRVAGRCGAEARRNQLEKQRANHYHGTTTTITAPPPPCRTAPSSPASHAPRGSPPADRPGRSPASTARETRTAARGAARPWFP